jgi:hypothetical protein
LIEQPPQIEGHLRSIKKKNKTKSATSHNVKVFYPKSSGEVRPTPSEDISEIALENFEREVDAVEGEKLTCEYIAERSTKHFTVPWKIAKLLVACAWYREYSSKRQAMI